MNANNMYQELGSSTSHKKTTGHVSLILFGTFNYESILIKKKKVCECQHYANANLIKYGLKGHCRSQKLIFILKIHFLLDIFIV